MKHFIRPYLFCSFFLLTMTYQMAIADGEPVNIDGYTWSEPGPQVLRTSQVSGGATRQACGNENFEVCLGTATKTDSPAQLVKCFIPKNTTICPTAINTANNCFVATATPPVAPGSIPMCHHRMPENDNLPSGCSCSHYGRASHVRATAAICDREMRERVSRNGTRACATGVVRMQGNACDSFCTEHQNFRNLPAQCRTTPPPPVSDPAPAPAADPDPAPAIDCPDDQSFNFPTGQCAPAPLLGPVVLPQTCDIGFRFSESANSCEPIESDANAVDAACGSEEPETADSSEAVNECNESNY
jgi:hypothetical protein